MLTNTATRYGSIARFFHWTIALLVLIDLALGLIGKFTPRNAGTADWLQVLYSVHKTIGVTVLALAVLRILWAFVQPRPVPLHPERRFETFAAEAAHWVLYGAILILPLSGWVKHSAEAGFAPIWWPFGQNLPLVPKSEHVAMLAGAVHYFAAIALFVTLAAHIGGALKHALIDRDNTLTRMWRGTEAGAGNSSQGRGHRIAPFAGVVFWLGLITLSVIVVEQRAGAGQEVPQVEAAQADDAAEGGDAGLAEAVTPADDPGLQVWAVQQGDLSFDVIQMGSEVTGNIGAWEAVIDYDPETGTGAVRVTMDMTSVTLGSVTDQALGAEFFDVETHATAVFEAEITRQDGQAHQAAGTLTLVGQAVPVLLAFDLTLDGDLAEMTGTATLDRRDFGIGSGYEDESTVGFAVVVNVTLSAAAQGG